MVFTRSAAAAVLTNMYVLFFGSHSRDAQWWFLKADERTQALRGCPLGDI